MTFCVVANRNIARQKTIRSFIIRTLRHYYRSLHIIVNYYVLYNLRSSGSSGTEHMYFYVIF